MLRVNELKVWSETVVDRLAALRPESYGPWAAQDSRGKANQLAAALKPYGVETIQVYGKTDRRDMTAAARQAFEACWERQVDPDGVLTPDERARRAEHAKKAHFQRMASSRRRLGAGAVRPRVDGGRLG